MLEERHVMVYKQCFLIHFYCNSQIIKISYNYSYKPKCIICALDKIDLSLFLKKNNQKFLPLIHRRQLSSTDLVESKMANIEWKFILVGYCKILSYSLFCLFLFQIYRSELICLTKCTGIIQSPLHFET